MPRDYFSAVEPLNARTTSAAVYPFEHARNPDIRVQHAQALYDASLHYYVAGLKWAGSPWAFHTIGSTLAINAAHYAQARGFPKRRAAEDFYLLNKLAKLGHIETLSSPPLADQISSRPPLRRSVQEGKKLPSYPDNEL